MTVKKYFYKKIVAAATALVMAFAATGCGESTSWIAKYNNMTVNAGIYLIYETEAFSRATTILKEDNPDIDLSDTKVLKNMLVEGVDISEWIKNQATEKLRLFVFINDKFDSLGLSLTDEEKSNINSMIELYWPYYSTEYEKNGIGKESFKQLMEFDYKEEKVFLYYYGEGGEYEYSDNELHAYLEGNYSRVKMIKLEFKDGNGEELDDTGKDEIRKMAEDYQKRANDGEDFNKLMDEYDDYKTKLAEEAAAEDENTEEVEEPAVTTVAEEETEDGAETEVTTVAEEETEDEAETEVTTVAEETEDEAKTEVTTAAEEEETEDEAEAEVTTVAEEETEDEAEVTTVAEETEDEAEVTTTVTTEPEETSEDEEDADPYEGESILFKGSEEEGYNPSQVVNEAVFNDCVVNGDSKIVEDEENLCIYVIKRYDILERTDFFEGDSRTGLLWEILEEEFESKVLEWLPEDSIDKNEKAFRRYDPFSIKVN